MASLAGRAVANTNIHPAPNKFRQFSSPKSFEVARKRAQNEVSIQQLFKRLWSSSGSSSRFQYVSVQSAFGCIKTLVADFLPCLRLIAPDRKFPFATSKFINVVLADDIHAKSFFYFLLFFSYPYRGQPFHRESLHGCPITEWKQRYAIAGR